MERLLISGRVVALGRDAERPYLSARIPVEIDGQDRVYRRVEVDIDTGFTGWLTLPESIIRELGVASYGRRPTFLANNEVRRLPLYRVLVEWHGVIRSVQVLQAEGRPLIGMSLLADCRLAVEAWEGGAVVIEERPR